MVNGMSSHLVFFNAVAWAFFDAFISNLATVFDKGTKKDPSISFYSNSQFSNHRLFCEVEDKGRKLFRYRSKFVAHRDYFMVANPDSFQSGLTHDDLGFLLNRCCEIFDDVAQEQGAATVCEFSCDEDIMRLIATLVKEQNIGS